MVAPNRSGKVCFHDASLSVWEEGISQARKAGGLDAANAWEHTFKREVFARIVQQLNRLGWTCVIPPDKLEHYKCIANNFRYCVKGDLKADLHISGRCIEFKMFQSVNCPTRPDYEGRYEHDKEGAMPYQLRLEMERTRRRIRDYLCNVFDGYRFEPQAPKMGIRGVTAMEYAQHCRRTSGHYVADLDRARISNTGQDKSADGHPLENGTRVYAMTRRGRIITGIAFYDLNGNWQIVTGRHDMAIIFHKQIWVDSPGNVRMKRDTGIRRKRLEGLLGAAIKAMNFERAAVLRDLLFPKGAPLYMVYHEEHGVYHNPGFCGYTKDASQAGKFTADEVTGWNRPPNRVVPLAAAVPA